MHHPEWAIVPQGFRFSQRASLSGACAGACAGSEQPACTAACDSVVPWCNGDHWWRGGSSRVSYYGLTHMLLHRKNGAREFLACGWGLRNANADAF